MGSPTSSIPTRRSLLFRLKDREDQKSWQEFYDTYWRMIRGLAVRAGLPEAEAQDVLQETMIKVAEKMPNFEYDPKIGSFKHWLCTVASSRVIDHLRKLGREKAKLVPRMDTTTRTSLVNRIPDPASVDLNAIWDQQWKQGIYAAALDQIRNKVSPKQFQLFDCYVRKQWPAQTVADFAGVPLSQVHLAKCRVTKLLAKEVNRLEARHS